MYVYVIYDPLLEQVVCVHDRADKWCPTCKKIQNQRSKERSVYFLEEKKRKIRTELLDTLD